MPLKNNAAQKSSKSTANESENDIVRIDVLGDKILFPQRTNVGAYLLGAPGDLENFHWLQHDGDFRPSIGHIDVETGDVFYFKRKLNGETINKFYAVVLDVSPTLIRCAQFRSYDQVAEFLGQEKPAKVARGRQSKPTTQSKAKADAQRLRDVQTANKGVKAAQKADSDAPSWFSDFSGQMFKQMAELSNRLDAVESRGRKKTA